MIVRPYKAPPAPPTVALLTPEGLAIDEHGEQLSLDRWPADTRLWASYESVYALVRDGQGEALCWNGEEIRWRHNRPEEGWKRRPSDANVLRLPFGDDHERTLSSLACWRDWLADHNASPTGTTGSAAWSLLRATLEAKLVTGQGERPPIGFTTGGRMQLGPRGRDSFRGELTHVDLSAAYASTLAGLRYGGVWLRADDTPGRSLERYAGRDYPVFVRARVRVPSGDVGPLLRRPSRRPRGHMEAFMLGQQYPTGATLQGVWTWEELHAAEAHGARILRVLDGWIHRSGVWPFAPWWEAIQAGRRMPGLAGTLAKVTGNALWGRFCMDIRSGGVRTIRSKSGRALISRKLPTGTQMFPAHDLAETVSGRVRAVLYGLMADRWPELVSAHTDGAWLLEERGSSQPPAEPWRVKEHARRLDLLDPQTLRYWPSPGHPSEPWVVYAGVPAERADAMFEEAWAKHAAAGA